MAFVVAAANVAAAEQLEQEASARALAAEERAAAARARPRDEAASLLAVLAPMRAPIDAAIAWQEGLLRTLDKRVGEDRRERPVRFASPYRPPAVNAPAPASEGRPVRFATPYRAPAVIDRTAQVEAAPAEPTAPTEPTAPIQATTIEVMAPKGPLGLRMRDANPGVIVEGLAETSPLAGQVTVGDVIVALDGEDTSAHSLIELFAMIRNRSDRERVLTIRRDPKPADDNTFANVDEADLGACSVHDLQRMLVAARINPSGCVEKSQMIALARAHMCLRKWARKYLRTTAAAAAPPTPPPRAELEPDPRRSSLMDTMSGALETLTEAIGLAESAAPEVEPVVQSAQPAAALAALGLDTVPSPAAARKAHFKAAKRVGNGERRAALDDALATILTALDGARVPEQSLPPAAAPAPAKRQSKRASGSEADFHDSFELMSREIRARGASGSDVGWRGTFELISRELRAARAAARAGSVVPSAPALAAVARQCAADADASYAALGGELDELEARPSLLDAKTAKTAADAGASAARVRLSARVRTTLDALRAWRARVDGTAARCEARLACARDVSTRLAARARVARVSAQERADETEGLRAVSTHPLWRCVRLPCAEVLSLARPPAPIAVPTASLLRGAARPGASAHEAASAELRNSPAQLLFNDSAPSSAASARASPTPWQAAQQLADTPLPGGWELCVDLRTGEHYFANDATGEEQATRPRELLAGWRVIAAVGPDSVPYYWHTSGNVCIARPEASDALDDGAADGYCSHDFAGGALVAHGEADGGGNLEADAELDAAELAVAELFAQCALGGSNARVRAKPSSALALSSTAFSRFLRAAHLLEAPSSRGARRGARAPSLTRSAADLVFLHCRRGEDGAVTHARGGSGAGFNSPMSLRVATSKRVTWGTFRERGLQRIAEVAGIPGGVRAVLEQIACAVREDATPTLFVNAAARDVARELLRHHAIASSGTTVAAPLPRNAPPPPFHPMTPAPVSEPRSRPHRERSCDRGAPSPALAVCSAPADRPIRFASPYRPPAANASAPAPAPEGRPLRFATPYRPPAVMNPTSSVEAVPAEPTTPTQVKSVEETAPKSELAAALEVLGLDTLPDAPAIARKAHFRARKRVNDGDVAALSALDDALKLVLAAALESTARDDYAEPSEVLATPTLANEPGGSEALATPTLAIEPAAPAAPTDTTRTIRFAKPYQPPALKTEVCGDATSPPAAPLDADRPSTLPKNSGDAGTSEKQRGVPAQRSGERKAPRSPRVSQPPDHNPAVHARLFAAARARGAPPRVSVKDVLTAQLVRRSVAEDRSAFRAGVRRRSMEHAAQKNLFGIVSTTRRKEDAGDRTPQPRVNPSELLRRTSDAADHRAFRR